MNISDEQVRQFEKDGFLILERILTDAQVESTVEAVKRLRSGICNRDVRPPAQRGPVSLLGTDTTFSTIRNARVLDAQIWCIATDHELGCASARLLRTSSVSMIEDQIVNKPAHGSSLKLHQDYSAYGFSISTNIVSCWIALMDMTEDLGPVECVRGSHLWGVTSRTTDLVHEKKDNDEYLSAANQIIPQGSNIEFVPAVVPKGGGVFFHGLTLHGSRPNCTDRPRLAATLHWAAADCRIDRSKLVGYGQQYLFNGISQGDPLVNKYLPRVYPA